MRVASVLLFLFAAGGGGGLAWNTASMNTAEAATAPSLEVRTLNRLTRLQLDAPEMAVTKPAPEVKEPVAVVRPAAKPKAAVAITEGPLDSASVAENASDPEVKAAYATGQTPLFVSKSGLTEVGRVAVRWLAEARFHHLLDVAAGYQATIVDGQPHPPARLEAALASWLARMAANLAPAPRTIEVVENPKTGAYISPDTSWLGEPLVKPVAGNVAALMSAAKNASTLDAYLHGLEPVHPQYRRLVDAAKRFDREICSKGDWGKVYVPKKSVGKTWANMAAIKRLQERLAAEGYYEGSTDGIYGDGLVAALKEYQSRQNLKPVGRFNTPTAKSLNMPCERRIKVLALNAQRWRHSALTPEVKTFVHVNIPGFQLRYHRNGKLAAERRVIVGKGHSWYSKSKKRRIYRNATPVLTDVIHSVIFNPSWTLPRRVVLNEINPKLEAEPDWLETHGYVRRKRADGRESIVQLPSSKNALGDVKFYFPNAESIYLHDTPRRGLFMRARRDFSHGCIRVHKAVEFATVVVRDDMEARGEKYTGGLKTLAAQDRTVRFKLHVPVPVFLEYYTTTVDKDGVAHFHPDIYDYDYAALVKPIGKMKPPTVW